VAKVKEANDFGTISVQLKARNRERKTCRRRSAKHLRILSASLEGRRSICSGRFAVRAANLWPEADIYQKLVVTKLSVRISTTEERARGFERARHRLSLNCHAKRGKWWQFANKKRRVKEKMSCQGSSQVTDFASLASALARFGKVGREATNQKVGSSSPPGRTAYNLLN